MDRTTRSQPAKTDPQHHIESTLDHLQDTVRREIDSDSAKGQIPRRFSNPPRAFENLQQRIDGPHKPITLVVKEEHFETVGESLSSRGLRNVDQLAQMLNSLDQSVTIEINHPSQLVRIEPCLYRLFDVYRFSAERVRVCRAPDDLAAGKIRMRFATTAESKATAGSASRHQ